MDIKDLPPEQARALAAWAVKAAGLTEVYRWLLSDEEEDATKPESAEQSDTPKQGDVSMEGR